MFPFLSTYASKQICFGAVVFLHLYHCIQLYWILCILSIAARIFFTKKAYFFVKNNFFYPLKRKNADESAFLWKNQRFRLSRILSTAIIRAVKRAASLSWKTSIRKESRKRSAAAEMSINHVPISKPFLYIDTPLPKPFP